MTLRFTVLLLAFGLQAPMLLAQTRTPVKPRSQAPKTTTTRKPTTKVTDAAKPAGRAPAPARPTSPAPAPPPAAPIKLEIPGVAAQQAPSFLKGTIAVNAGLGLGIGYGYSQEFDDAGRSTSSPALSVSAEKGILDAVGPGVISVGGLLGYTSYSQRWTVGTQNYKANWTNVYVAARVAYHYNFTDNPKVDTYAGISLAARIEKHTATLETPGFDGGGVHLETGVFVGGRYMFTDKLGVFSELGYDMSYLKLGFTTKF